MFIVALSNYLVQFPINDWLTFGAFTYPLSFLVTELTNNRYGSQKACHVVLLGFLLGVYLSFILAPLKIALTSGLTFLTAQMLDIAVFNRLRTLRWWIAPLSASFIASAIDTFLFFGMAFYGENVPLLTWALGDFGVKIGMDLCMLAPFRFFMAVQRQQNRYTHQEHKSQLA